MMGKRHVIVVSSEEEEHERDPPQRRCCSSSKSRPNKSRSAKKARNTATLHKQSSGIEEIDLDMLSEELHGFNVVPGRQWGGSTELWIDKYKPSSVTDLAVNRKKIEEIKVWMEQSIGICEQEGSHTSCLLITGPAGVGKSTTVHVLASILGAEVCEWNTPTPTLWHEHLHNSNSGVSYNSKLDEFKTFVERMRKYPLLHSFSREGSRKPSILLIDDLPVANGRVAYARLSKCLQLLVQLSQMPTIILFTGFRSSDSGYDKIRNQEDLQSELERAGASKVSFNPITVNNVKKVLSRICREEFCEVSSEFLEHIARASDGDIRHAITTLQYLCSRPQKITSLHLSAQRMTCPIQQANESSDLSLSVVNTEEDTDAKFLLPFGKDETLSLFHALGKFLHNKRESVQPSDFGKCMFPIQERLCRPPLKMDAPEKVLSQAHAQPGSLIDFLHENVLDFLGDEAVDDACTVASYLSECDQLHATVPYGSTMSWLIARKDEPDSIPQLVAALVAVRGVLFGNSHPSPSRWHSIRAPKLWQTEFSFLQNKNQMFLEKFEEASCINSSGLAVMATEFRPALKWLQHRGSGVGLHKKQGQHCQIKAEAADWMVDDQSSADGDLIESEDDEIEDW